MSQSLRTMVCEEALRYLGGYDLDDSTEHIIDLVAQYHEGRALYWKRLKALNAKIDEAEAKGIISLRS